MRYDRDEAGNSLPPDLQKDASSSASSAASTSANSYKKTVKLPVVIGKTYKFWFTYLHQDSETKKISESNNSPVFTTTFQIPNETKPVLNLILTSGIKSYGVKFDLDPTSVQTDIIIYESLTGVFAGEEYIVYVGTSTNVSIHTDSFAPRWVKVSVRDNWLDANRSSVIAGPVSILANDPDTSTAPSAPSGVSVTGSIDPDDKSGFSGQIYASWTVNSDTNTSGYVIRWSTQNPVTTQNPVWEYGQVDGRETTRFSVTGLIPNTLYYYQVTAKSPYNALSWTSPSSGTFGPIVDANAPADAFAQLRSILSIGGKTADLFKIGTGISQSINTSTTITPSQTSGTYSGIILNKSTTNFGHNYWLNTGQFRVGSSSAFLFWDGSDLYTTGKINATGGSFTGDVRLNGGTLYTGPTPLSGARVRFDSAGLFGYDATSTSNTTGQTFALTAADGKIDARLGYIGGWTIQGTDQTVGTISKNGTILGSDGSIVLGDTTGTLNSIVKLSSTDPTYRIWVGSQTSSNAKFKVGTDGTLYATGAVIGGYPTTSAAATDAQTRADAAKAAAIAAAASDATTKANAAQSAAASDATTKANLAKSRADSAYDKAVAAADGVTAADLRITNTNNVVALKVAAADVATAINDNVTKIEGAKIVTGSIELSTLKVVGNTTNGLLIDNTGIKAYSGSTNTFSLSTNGALSLTGQIFSTTGQIGGFDLSNADLTASTSKLPRIIFGSKILMGWLAGSDYGLRVGNPYGTAGQSFRVNTADNVNRITVDSADTTYAAEIRNIVRAVGFRHMGSGFVADSSRRFKENINEMPKAYYERILNVPINFYTYKNNIADIPDAMWGTHNFGPIVEDMEDAGLGFFVERNLEGQPTSFRNEQKYAFLLIPIVRDMKLKIEQMEAKILELESR